jgi:hypothetical protein
MKARRIAQRSAEMGARGNWQASAAFVDVSLRVTGEYPGGGRLPSSVAARNVSSIAAVGSV